LGYDTINSPSLHAHAEIVSVKALLDSKFRIKNLCSLRFLDSLEVACSKNKVFHLTNASAH